MALGPWWSHRADSFALHLEHASRGREIRSMLGTVWVLQMMPSARKRNKSRAASNQVPGGRGRVVVSERLGRAGHTCPGPQGQLKAELRPSWGGVCGRGRAELKPRSRRVLSPGGRGVRGGRRRPGQHQEMKAGPRARAGWRI